MIRIGIVGSDNSHADAFSQMLNIADSQTGEFAYPDVRVTAIFGLDEKRTAEVALDGKIEHIVKDPSEMIGMVDAVMKYDTIIFGGGLYASGISGISLITKNFEKLKEKNLIVFTVGLADPSQKEQFKPILDKNFEADMLEKIAIFHLRGSIDYKKLGIIHQSMMAMLKAIIKRKGEKMTNEDKQFFESYGKKVDFKDRLSIKPLLSYVKNEF